MQYSRTEVIEVGKKLKGPLIWNDETAEEIRRIFSVASHWRDSHEPPMRRVRSQLLADCKKLNIQGLAAARLKRMASVRRKLSRVNENLARLQDLAGCRVVLPDISSVEKLSRLYGSGDRHRVHRINDYILDPKNDGYRSKHIVLDFTSDEYGLDGASRKVEVQVRTRLQHAWATAVESVGLFLKQDFKSGGGDDSWRRIFYLMSCEFAQSEGCPIPIGAPQRRHRIEELRKLNAELNAAELLQNLTIATQYLDIGHLSKDAPKYWQLTYDAARKTVTIEEFFKVRKGTESYGKAELQIHKEEERKNTVLVQVDEVQNLAAAYPNYFGDVRLFKNNLLKIVAGEEVTEYTLPPIFKLPRQPKPIPDDSWMRFPRNRRWN